MSGTPPDPSLLERTVVGVPATSDAALPSRPMTIAGFDGSLEARILSRSQKGPATRLVRFPVGWGSNAPGAFTADFEAFVVSGMLEVGGHALGRHDYAAARAGTLVRGVKALESSLVVVMTSAPLRYDRSAGGALADPVIGLSREHPWEAVPELPGRFTRRLAEGPHGLVWLSGARSWGNDDGPWHTHTADEEVLALTGSWLVTERVEGIVDAIEYRPGVYRYRVAGTEHGGPGSRSSETAMSFHRIMGEPHTEWLTN